MPRSRQPFMAEDAADPALGRQLNLLEILLDRMPMGLGILDRDLRVHRFNPTWATFVGRYSPVTAAQIVPGARLLELLPGSEPDLVPVLRRALAGEVVRQDAFRLEVAGTSAYWDMVLAPLLEEGGVVGLVHVITDATERVRAADALRSAYATLEQRVTERTAEIEQRRQVAEGLRDILAVLNSERSPREILDYIVALAHRLLGAELTVLHRIDYEHEFVRIEATWGLPAELAEVKGFPLHASRADEAILEQRPYYYSRPAAQPPPPPTDPNLDPSVRAWRAVTAVRYRAFLSAPLVVRGEVYGSMAFYYAEPHDFTAEQVDLAVTFAEQAALAIENARLRAQSEESAAVAERVRLARELHDSVSQTLYGIGLGAQTARKLLDQREMPAATRSALAGPLDYVLSLAEAGLAEMRALILELRPDALEKEGLCTVLDRHVAAVRARHELEVRAELGEEPDLPIEVKESLYRIAQEALHNVVKHAHARQVEVRLYEDESAVVLEVQDDGAGFDPHGDYPGHLGLCSMRERAERRGGTLRVESAPGQGTLVRARVPKPT